MTEHSVDGCEVWATRTDEPNPVATVERRGVGTRRTDATEHHDGITLVATTSVSGGDERCWVVAIALALLTAQTALESGESHGSGCDGGSQHLERRKCV